MPNRGNLRKPKTRIKDKNSTRCGFSAKHYFGSLFAAVEFHARKTGIRTALPDEVPSLSREDWIRSLAFFAPVAAIIYCLWAGHSVNRAGFWVIAATVLFGLLNSEFRRNPASSGKAASPSRSCCP